MKRISETRALKALRRIKTEYAREIRETYETKAEPCATCSTPGACCLDAHFVNVEITRLEAVAIKNALSEMEAELRDRVYSRVGKAIEDFKLDAPAANAGRAYACPLYEKGIGCLVHSTAKPIPCIQHACYEKKEDLPPDSLQYEKEIEVGRLNRMTYSTEPVWRPLPVALIREPRS